jgi:hypothetical protein
MRLFAFVIGAFLLAGGSLPAQEPAYRDDLRFAERLRARGDSDLALEYLQKMAKGASADLAKELPLEFAKTRLRVASNEPDTGKRLALYRQAREDFASFIRGNRGHPRVAEANVEIARVLNLQGKTELSKAYLTDDAKAKVAAAKQARATLQEASERLDAAAKELEGVLAKAPDPETTSDKALKKQYETERRRLEDEVLQTRLDRALNLYDQAQTFDLESSDDALAAGSQRLQDAIKLLQPIDGGPPASPIKWKATAWLGRCIARIDTAAKGRSKLAEVIGSRSPAAAEGERLARYFRLLIIDEKPEEEEKKKTTATSWGNLPGVRGIIIESAERWRRDYPRYHKAPEGYGISYLLAQTYLGQAEATKNKPQADKFRDAARALLREVEEGENEFTERARRLKIAVLARQGVFKRPIKNLRSFEEFYVRAQFEDSEISRLAKEAKDFKEFQKKRQAHLDTLLDSLQRALSLPEVKKGKVPLLELNRARLGLAYWSLVASKYRQAVAVGEGFARADPRSAQAAQAAIYALEAYPRLIAETQKALADPDSKEKVSEEDVTRERNAMFRLARYMEERWPREQAGDKARHEIGLQLLREKNYAEGIKRLAAVSPGYSQYALAQWQLAGGAFEAAKESVEPITGDRPGDYRRRGLAALASIPESALGHDPETNAVYVRAKAIVVQEWYKAKRFKDMEGLLGSLLARLPKLRLGRDEAEDAKVRAELRGGLVAIGLFSRYGQAEVAFNAGDHKTVLALLDPLVDQLNKDEATPEKAGLKGDPRLAMAMLAMALKSNIQEGKIDRTDAALDALDKVSGEGGDGGANNILKLLAFLIRQQVDDLRKKGDKEDLAKAVKGYTAILDKRIRKQKDLTPEFIRVLADCYASMGQHAKAAGELAKVPPPKAKDGPEVLNYKAVQLLQVRELRLAGGKNHLKEASKLMDAVMGTVKSPGWGRRDLNALIEQGKLLEAKAEYPQGFGLFANLVKQLVRRAGTDPRLKERYLECHFHMVRCYLKNGLHKGKSKAERDKVLRTAARQILDLEKSWDGFGSDSSKKRYDEMFEEYPELWKMHEALKKGK